MERLLCWGQAVVHIFDQGFASAFGLGVLLAFGLRFVLRWRADYQLYEAPGNRRKAWRLAIGKRGWSERSQGRTPWYLVTAEPLTTDEDAWRVVFAYVRRWQIDLTWRCDKRELAFQRPRLWREQERAKLLALATLAYAFLLQLRAPRYEPLRLWLLRTFCHRTGQHLRRVKLPLSRLRSALSRLWQR